MHGKTYTKAMAYSLLYLAVSVFMCLNSQLAYAASPLHLYVELKGNIQSEEERELPPYFHLDVYHINHNGDMVLIRTGRQLGSSYTTYLQKGLDHILVFDLEGFPYHEVYISKNDISSADNLLLMDIVLPLATQDIQSMPVHEAPPLAMPAFEEEAVESLLDTSYIEEVILQSIVLPESIDTIHVQDELFQGRPILGLLDTTYIEIEEPASVASIPEIAPVDQQSGYQEHNAYYTTSAVMPLYEKFGGRGEVLTEVISFDKVEVLEQTTTRWWMVEYKTEIGWVDAKQLEYHALTTNLHQANPKNKE
jgi:hypothetical protein